MPNDVIAGRAICPFFKKAEKNWICCECAIGGSRLMHVFPSRAKQEEHVDGYCCAFAYVRCEYAMMLIGMYGDE